MTNPMQILRSPSTAFGTLLPGQLAWKENTQDLAIGLIGGGNALVGGQGTFAKLASPTFTGSPAAPTASPGDNSTLLATTAFVFAAALAAINGLSWKNPVQITTAAALAANTQAGSGVGATLTSNAFPGAGGLVIDGVTTVAGWRVLIKDEVTAKNNGIYTVTAVGTAGANWVLTRAVDCDTTAEYLDNSTVLNQQVGTVNKAGAQFSVTSVGAITVDTTAVTWGQIAGPGVYTADETSVHAAANVFSIKTTWPGQAAIITVGTITTGTWNGTGIDVAHGGTGAATLTGMLKGTGTTAITPATANVDFMNPAGIQNNAVVWAISGGSANAQTLTMSPASGAIAAGQEFTFKAGFSNTLAATMAVDGHTATALTKFGATALVAGDIVAGNIYTIVSDGTQYQLLNPSNVGSSYTADETSVHLAANVFSIKTTWPGQAAIVTVGTITSGTWNGTVIDVIHGGTGLATLTSGALLKGAGTGNVAFAVANTDFMNPVGVQNQTATFIADTGSSTVYACALVPAITSYVTGFGFWFMPLNTNTTTGPTMNVNAQGAKNICKGGGAGLVNIGDIVINVPCHLTYDGTLFQLDNFQVWDSGTF